MIRQRTVCAIRLLRRLHDTKPTSLAKIATEQNVSLSYMEQIAAPLRDHGYIAGIRGPGGGYIRLKDLHNIEVHEIDQALYRDNPGIYVTGISVDDVLDPVGTGKQEDAA